MSGPRASGSSRRIKHAPPAGSRLAAYVARFHEIAPPGDLSTWWSWLDSDRPEARAAGFSVLLREGVTVDKLPRKLVREFVVVPSYEKVGMPSGDPPPWLDTLLEEATDACIQRYRKTKLRPVPANKVRSTAQLIIVAAFLQLHAGDSTNAAFTATANRLGPGLNDDHVRTAVKAYFRDLRFVSAGPDGARLSELWQLSLAHYQRLMNELDVDFELVRKPGSKELLFVHKEARQGRTSPQTRRP